MRAVTVCKGMEPLPAAGRGPRQETPRRRKSTCRCRRGAYLRSTMDPRAVKKILVPTDFSELSGEAVQTAVDFAKAFGASVELVHVFVEPAVESIVP